MIQQQMHIGDGFVILLAPIAHHDGALAVEILRAIASEYGWPDYRAPAAKAP
jgi:hypothetical protein